VGKDGRGKASGGGATEGGVAGEHLYRVVAPHYVAGVRVRRDRVTYAAPILGWAHAKDKPWHETERYLLGKGYTVDIVNLPWYNSQHQQEITMSEVFEGVVGVNMESKYSSPGNERRIKFEDNQTWFGASLETSEKLGRGWKVKVKTEGTGNDAMVTKVQVIEKSEPKSKGGGGYGGKKGGGGGGKSQLSKEEWALKDEHIKFEHAQKVGVALLELQIATAVFKVPAKNKEEAFMTQYDRLVAVVYSDIKEFGAVTRVKGETEEPDEMEDDEVPGQEDDGFGDDEDDGFDD
jgi:hypothetical protein